MHHFQSPAAPPPPKSRIFGVGIFRLFFHFSDIQAGLEIAVIGLVFLAPKVAFSWPSVDRLAKIFGDL